MAEHKLTLAMNLKNLAPSQYRAFDMDSMAAWGGRHVASNSDGFFLLGGDSDGVDGEDNPVPIDAFFETIQTDFGSDRQKRVAMLLAGYEASGNLAVTVSYDNQAVNADPLAPRKSAQTPHAVRTPVPRRGVGCYVSVRIANVDGADFAINRIQAEVIFEGRRPSGS